VSKHKIVFALMGVGAAACYFLAVYHANFTVAQKWLSACVGMVLVAWLVAMADVISDSD